LVSWERPCQGRFLLVSPGSVREICRVEARAAYDGFVSENKRREGEGLLTAHGEGSETSRPYAVTALAVSAAASVGGASLQAGERATRPRAQGALPAGMPAMRRGSGLPCGVVRVPRMRGALWLEGS